MSSKAVVFCMLSLVGAIATSAFDAVTASAGDVVLTPRQLSELLRTSKEPPVLEEQRPPLGSRSEDLTRIIGYDAATKIVDTVEPVTPPAGRSGSDRVPSFVPGDAVIADDVPEGGGHPRATFPQTVYATREFPFSTVVKLLMRFSVDGLSYYYVCSAATTDDFHLLTAGHCIYNWDPNGDGNTSDKQFARDIWAFPAQTDVLEPIGSPDWPFGQAMSVYMRTYTGWSDFGSFDHDWGVITLDRRVGQRTGWMGREAGITTTALNFSGYPVEEPYVSRFSLVQYRGFENVLGYSDTRIGLDALTFGGHSGGPVWRYNDDRYIEGMNSTSNRQGYAEATRLTIGKFNDLNAFIAADETSRSPTPRPYPIEYVLGPAVKGVSPNSARPGGPVTVTYNVLNGGFASAPVYVDFYLSSDPYIDGSDYFIGSDFIFDLGPNVYANPSVSLTVPTFVPQGSYYVGWTMSSPGGYDSSSAVIGDEVLDVAVAPPDAAGCHYKLSPTSAKLGPTAADGTFVVTTEPACPVSVVSESPWVFASASADAGTNFVFFSVDHNDGPSKRTGVIRIVGENGKSKVFKVKQGKCTFALSSGRQRASSLGADGSVQIFTQQDCEWFAVSSVPWITVFTPDGVSSSTVEYAVDPLPFGVKSRSGVVFVGGKKLKITQQLGL